MIAGECENCETAALRDLLTPRNFIVRFIVDAYLATTWRLMLLRCLERELHLADRT